MKVKKIVKFETIFPIVLILIIILGIILLYLKTDKSFNKNPKNYVKNQKIKIDNQEQEIKCKQIDKAIYNDKDKKYIVTIGSNSSSTTWSIQNILNCSPLGGSGSIFETKCMELGNSIATISYGNEQATCEFSTEP